MSADIRNFSQTVRIVVWPRAFQQKFRVQVQRKDWKGDWIAMLTTNDPLMAVMDARDFAEQLVKADA